MRSVVIVLLLAVSGCASAQKGADQVCRTIQSDINATDFPVYMDDYSQLVERSTLYVQGRCVVRNVVQIDSQSLINSKTEYSNAQGIGTHRDTVVEHLLSKEGRDAMINFLQQGAEQSSKDLMKVPNVTIYITYETSDPIPPFTITIESGDM